MSKGNMLRGFMTVELRNKDGSVELKQTSENTFVDGFRNQLLTAIGDGSTTSSKAAYIGIGTGGAVSAASTAIVGEFAESLRVAADSTVSANSRLRLTGSYASNVCTGNISNMGLYSKNSGSCLIAGNTFSASFAKASNQELSVTYDITFSG